jgi:hypothetical protein
MQGCSAHRRRRIGVAGIDPQGLLKIRPGPSMIAFAGTGGVPVMYAAA